MDILMMLGGALTVTSDSAVLHVLGAVLAIGGIVLGFAGLIENHRRHTNRK